MPKQLVYVHGAGRQKPAPALKHDIDMVLFGKDMPTSRIGYYANVRWPSAATPAGPAVTAIGAASKTRRTSAIRATLDPHLSANDAANEIVDATLRGPGGGAVAAAVAGTTPAEIAQAKRLVAQLYRRADKIAARSAAPAPAAGLGFGPTFPDPMFRWVVGRFASDVIDYLYGPFKAAMQAPVIAAIKATPRPKVVLAHSLGTIITYDVLADPSMTGLSDVNGRSPSAARSGSATSRTGCATAPAARTRSRTASRPGRTSPTGGTRSRWTRRCVTSSSRRRTCRATRGSTTRRRTTTS